MLDDKGQITAEAQDVMVLFDFNKNEKIPFSKELKDKIEQLEGRTF